MKTYAEEIVFIEAQDGVSLIGAEFRSIEAALQPFAFMLIHGNTGKFCDYPYVMIARLLAERGYTVINGNTRGHDISATLYKMPEDVPTAGGSAWELYEDSPHDVAAWIEYAQRVGRQDIILIGHSQGAAKAIYYQAQRQDPRVKGIVLASPDLRGHWTPELVAHAQGLVSAGKGDELLPALMGAHWYRLSARNVVSRANVLSRTYTSENESPYIASVRCPLLAILGTAGDVGGADELNTIKRNAVNCTRVETLMIEGADHVYTKGEAHLAEMLVKWMRSL